MPVFSHNLLIFWHCMVHTMTDKSLAHWELLSEDLSAQHCLPISETFVNKVVWGMMHPTARVTPLSGSRFADTSQNVAKLLQKSLSKRVVLVAINWVKIAKQSL